ncbi:MAG: phosphate ABC transporter ATP-binding protein [Alphaproteobacteria bacterium]|nr:phosphate ABC transporter ATP-binding protein [Alphaproteobacteria bacterium]
MTHAPDEPRILPLALENVAFEARGMRLIKDLSCRFEEDRRTVIIGPNGAGKSLLLRLCHGLIPPSAGTVRWCGVGAQRGSQYITHRQAMVFQRPVMLRRSVAANVDYALSLRGIGRNQRRTIVDQVLQQTGLRRLWDNPARVLSGGEQQRLALARAWALSPEVLFLDEPTANLDPSATHSVEEIINAIHATGTRIIMTTHDLGQARRMADEVMFLHRGRLMEHAPADAFFEHPQNDLAQAFLRGELLWWKRGKDNRKREKGT